MKERYRIFLLSPAHSEGDRARLLLNSSADFAMARSLRSAGGAPLGDVFSFVSGLYFRGKLAYARRFGRPPAGLPGVVVITPNRGLLSPDELITVNDLVEFSAVKIDEKEAKYREPLERDAAGIAGALDEDAEVILLGSVATGKYVSVLSRVFGKALLFPSAFVGRGDMSRGGLLLRCVEEGQELDYIPIEGSTRRGRRPSKLPPKKRSDAV